MSHEGRAGRGASPIPTSRKFSTRSIRARLVSGRATVDTVEEAKEVVRTPISRPSADAARGAACLHPKTCGQCAGRYRHLTTTVVIVMIETLEGLKNADDPKVPASRRCSRKPISAIFRLQDGRSRYERAINIVHDAAIKRARTVRSVRVERRPDSPLPGRHELAAIRARRERTNWRARHTQGQKARSPARSREVILKAVQGSSHLMLMFNHKRLRWP